MPSRIAARSVLGGLRAFSSSPLRREEVVGVVGQLPPRRSGGFRGGILGFLLGFASASAAGLYYLQQETTTASASLIGSIEQLQQGSAKINSYLDRLQAMEKELETLKARAAEKEDVSKARGEARRLYDGLHLEVLDLRAHVWGVEQDLGQVVKHDSIKI